MIRQRYPDTGQTKKARGGAELISIAAISILFAGWAAGFIYRSSFTTINGDRAYSLVDDAMISMRYAWNFSHGNGLVWNRGEYVQGYSNPLMTLVMALATWAFDKPTAVLVMQILGIPLMLGSALLAMRIADRIWQAEDDSLRAFVRVLAFAGALAYYPLAYWSLMGMETGLLTALLLAGLLMAIRYAQEGDSRAVMAAAVFFGLAVWTRMDSALYAVPVWAYLAWDSMRPGGTRRLDQLLYAGGVLAIISGALLGFQYAYYGSLLPNTYTLKLTGMPLTPRLENGFLFIAPFFKETALMLALAIGGVLIRHRAEKLMLLAFIVVAVLYQVDIGGDGWNYWRLLAPVLPLALILDIDLLVTGAGRVMSRLVAKQSMAPVPTEAGRGTARALAVVCLLPGLLIANARFAPEISLRQRPNQVDANQMNVDIAMALNEVLMKKASIGVFWAGALPYYADFRAVDFLGKSDRYIAALQPDLSGASGGLGTFSLPGHNKYDLPYSIMTLRPTFVQGLMRGRQDLSAWGQTTYVSERYKGVTLLLLKDSPDVDWTKLRSR